MRETYPGRLVPNFQVTELVVCQGLNFFQLYKYGAMLFIFVDWPVLCAHFLKSYQNPVNSLIQLLMMAFLKKGTHTFVKSKHFVSIIIQLTFCCHTIRQKSATVSSSGP